MEHLPKEHKEQEGNCETEPPVFVSEMFIACSHPALRNLTGELLTVNQTRGLVPSESEQLLPSLPLLSWIVLGVTLPSTRLVVTGVREGLCCQTGSSKASPMEGEERAVTRADVGAATVPQNTRCCCASTCCSFLENRPNTFKAGFTQYAE